MAPQKGKGQIASQAGPWELGLPGSKVEQGKGRPPRSLHSGGGMAGSLTSPPRPTEQNERCQGSAEGPKMAYLPMGVLLPS